MGYCLVYDINTHADGSRLTMDHFPPSPRAHTTLSAFTSANTKGVSYRSSHLPSLMAFNDAGPHWLKPERAYVAYWNKNYCRLDSYWISGADCKVNIKDLVNFCRFSLTFWKYMLEESIKRQVLFIVFTTLCSAYCMWIWTTFFLSHSIKIQVFVIFIALCYASSTTCGYVLLNSISLFTSNWWIQYTRALLLWGGVDYLPSTVPCWKIASLHPYLIPTMEIPTIGAHDTWYMYY